MSISVHSSHGQQRQLVLSLAAICGSLSTLSSLRQANSLPEESPSIGVDHFFYVYVWVWIFMCMLLSFFYLRPPCTMVFSPRSRLVTRDVFRLNGYFRAPSMVTWSVSCTSPQLYYINRGEYTIDRVSGSRWSRSLLYARAHSICGMYLEHDDPLLHWCLANQSLFSDLQTASSIYRPRAGTAIPEVVVSSILPSGMITGGLYHRAEHGCLAVIS